MYILNLAISDMLLLMQVFSFIALFTLRSSENTSAYNCTFIALFSQTSFGMSAYSVALLSIQRYNVTVNPFHVRVSSQLKRGVTVATICGVWIVAALFSVPTALSKYYCVDSVKEFMYIAYYQRVSTFNIFVFCVLLLFLIAFSYIMTARHLLKNANPISEETQNPQLNARKTAANVVLGLTVVLVTSYVSLYATEAYLIFNSDPYAHLTHLNGLDEESSNTQGNVNGFLIFLFFFL